MSRALQPGASGRAGFAYNLIMGALLISMTLVVYGQVVHFDFLLWDDPQNVVENPRVQDGLTGNNFLGAFTEVMITHWQPLTTISHMLDVNVFGMNPGGHHITSLMLHIFNTLLLFIVLHSMTGARWPSVLAAALFALHPLHVEPVAWISGRRDVLSMFFGLLSMVAYVSYARRGGVGRYALVALFLVLALLAKSMLVTLPLVFLLLDYWPLCRVRMGRQDNVQASGDTAVVRPSQSIRRVVLEKVPLLILSAVVCLVALLMLRDASETKLVDKVPFPLRAAHAVVSYVWYVEKMVWPTRFSPHYVHPNLPGGTPWAPGHIIGAGLVLIVISVLVARMSSRRYLTVGWLWYLGTLVPVIGLVQLGKPGMADRYTYVPLIGLFIMIAWGGREILGKWRARQSLVHCIGLVCAIVVLGACMACSWWHVRPWRNSKDFFAHALEVSPTNAYLHNNCGVMFLRESQYEEAVEHFRRALQIKPDLIQAHRNLSIVLRRCGQYREASRHYQEAQRIESSVLAARGR